MIGGNIYGSIQIKSSAEKNEIGEKIEEWEDVQEIYGWLDLQSGNSTNTSFNAKIQESTHIFVSDYTALDSRITAENSRMIVDGKRYDVTYIDDPMGVHKQIEIFLKYTGGQ